MTNDSTETGARDRGTGKAGTGGSRGLQARDGRGSGPCGARRRPARQNEAFPFLVVMVPMLALMALALAGAIGSR